MKSFSSTFHSPLRILACLGGLLLAGCSPAGGQSSEGGPRAVQRADESLPEILSRVCTVDSFRQPEAPSVNKIDVLFVMDNSESMNRHWQLMANKIDRLIKEFPKESDIRFAVILGTIEKYSGRLYAAPGVPLVLDGTKLSSAQVSSHLRKTFAAATEYTDLTGAGEALFYSLYAAAGANAKTIQKQGFFRPDAALQLMMMSDDAEIGFKYPSRQPWNLPPKCNYNHHESVRKSHYLPRGINTDTTFQLLRRLKGDRPLAASAFVNITKEDILVDNRLDAECIFDSPGYGYFDLVKKSGGVLYSIHRDRGEGLARAAKTLRARLNLVYDFKLSKPADKVDPATIEARVDGKASVHAYNSLTNMVTLENAGRAGSEIAIRHCEPDSRQEWAITGFAGAAEQFTASLSWQTLAAATAGRLLYGTSPDALNNSVETEKNTSHQVRVIGLTANTTYYFQVSAVDEFGTEQRSEVISLTTKPDWELSGWGGEASRNSVALRWATNYPTAGRIFWGESSDSLPNTTAETPASESHQLTLSGLSAGTTYYFQVLAKDSFGLEKRSPVFALRTIADWAIVGFGGVVGRNSATLVWQTPDFDTTGLVRFGNSPENLNQLAPAEGISRAHQVEINGLEPGTTYYFQAFARDSLGADKQSEVIALTTAADWVVGPLALSSTESSFAASFTTPGYPTNGKFLWGLSAEALSETAQGGSNATEHAAQVSNLSEDTLYYVQAVATDRFGVEKRSPVLAVRTKANLPPLPAWAITDLEGSATAGSISLRWKTNSYATSGQVWFGREPGQLDQSLLSPVNTSHEVEAVGLQPDTLYYFRVVARDDRGQEQTSAVISVRTQALPLPTWEITEFGGAATQSSAQISWATFGYPTSGLVRWGTSPNALVNSIASPFPSTRHGVAVNGLQPNTTYYFQAQARDDRGQEQVTEVIAIKTQPAPVGDWEIQGFDGTTTVNSATLIWRTPGADTKALVRIGKSADDLSFRTIEVDEFKSVHLVTVNGLEANTAYYFQVRAIDAGGNEQTSVVITKRTK
jgi:hypothetical protein